MELMDRIFLECMNEFQEKGMKFTMDELAARLGISKRTLYETVPSKRELVNLVIDRTFFDVKKQQSKILENEALSTLEKIEQMLRIVPTYAKALDYRKINTIKKGYPALYRKITENIEGDWEKTLELLTLGMEERVIKRYNLVVLKILLCGIFERILDGNELYEVNVTYEEALNNMIDIIFDGIRMHKEQKPEAL